MDRRGVTLHNPPDPLRFGIFIGTLLHVWDSGMAELDELPAGQDSFPPSVNSHRAIGGDYDGHMLQ